MATFTKRGDRWQAKIRKKGHKVLTKSFLLYEDAEKWARKTESSIERGVYIESDEEARGITIKEAGAIFIKNHISRLKHPAAEKNRLEAMLDRTGWGVLSLPGLKSKDIIAYVKMREESGLKPDTIRLDLAVLSRLFKFAREDMGLEGLRNPVDAVRRPSLRGTARTRRLEDGEEDKLIDAAAVDFKPIILFALETAMRREEIATLAWENINLSRRTAHLPKTKNGEARTVPLSSRAIAILQALPRNLDKTRPVFGLSKDAITKRMRTCARRAGLEDLRFHDLRHEATSRFFERGTLDMMEVASITGHKTLTMLRRYTHLKAENLAAKLG